MSKRIRGWRVGTWTAPRGAGGGLWQRPAWPSRSRAGRGVEGRAVPRPASRPPTRTTSRTWTRAAAHAARRSRAATCGWCGPAATIASGTPSPYQLRHPRLPEDAVVAPDDEIRPRQPLDTSAWSTSRASRRRPAPIRSATACGSTSAIRAACRSVRERAKYPGVAHRRPRQDGCPSAPTTASPPASSVCGSFRTPASTRARQAKWDSERYYRDPDYYFSKDLVKPYRVGMSCGFCHVGRIRSNRRPIPRTRSGRT